MIFLTRKRLDEYVARRVMEEQERIRIDRRLNEMEDGVRKLIWRMNDLEAANKHDVPVCPQTQCACKGDTT